MLIHSVTHPQMLIEWEQMPSSQYKQVAGGYAQVYSTSSGNRVERLCSTDLSMYLNSEYSPGSYCK